MSEESIRVSPGRPMGSSGSGASRPALPDLERLPLALIVFALISLAVLVAAAVDDGFGAERAWLYVTILGSAFIVSRGLAHHAHRN